MYSFWKIKGGREDDDSRVWVGLPIAMMMQSEGCCVEQMMRGERNGTAVGAPVLKLPEECCEMSIVNDTQR